MEIVFALIIIVAVVFVFVLFKNTKAGYERQIDELKKQLETEREYAKRMLDQADDNLQRANQTLIGNANTPKTCVGKATNDGNKSWKV